MQLEAHQEHIESARAAARQAQEHVSAITALYGTANEDADAIGTSRSGIASHVQQATSTCWDLLAMKESATEALQTAPRKLS